jgi:DNA polymerase III epsilon subunit-like protein
VYHSAPALLAVPARAVPSTATAFAAALAKAEARAKKLKQEAAKEKAMKKLLASGNIYGTLEIEEDEPEPELSDSHVVQSAAPERSEASIPQAHLLDDITVLDTEFVPDGAHLLEIAAIRYLNGEAQPAFVSFVRFDGYVPRFITELTGISALHVYGPTIPGEKQVLQQFFQYAGSSLLIAHNVSADRRVIEATRARLGAAADLPNPWLCTMALARKRLAKGQKVGLSELCQHFLIKTRGHHRAKRDVEMCYQVLRKLHELQPVTKGDLHGAEQPGKNKKNAVPAGPGLFAAA